MLNGEREGGFVQNVDLLTIAGMVVIAGGFRTRRGRGPGYPLKRSKKRSESKDKQTQTRPYTTPKSPRLPSEETVLKIHRNWSEKKIIERLQF